jgi:membrane protein
MRLSLTRLFKQTYAEWSEDKGPRLGAALAYYAIFSIPPLMIIALAVIGFVYSGNITERLQTQLASLVGDDTAKTLLLGVQMQGQKGGLLAGLVGIGILLFGASGVFAELQDALNTIWGVKPKEEGLKGLVRGRFTSFTMVLGTCFLLLVSLIISSIVVAMSETISAWIPGGAVVGNILENASAFIVITLLFSMIFKILPDIKIGWNDVWVGAALTALFFTIGKFVIGMYIGKTSIGSGYGAAGSVVVLIAWIYYSAQILFFGAEFTQVYARLHGTHVIPKENAEVVVPLRGTQSPTKSSTTPDKPMEHERTSLTSRPRTPWSYAILGIAVVLTLLPHHRKDSKDKLTKRVA